MPNEYDDIPELPTCGPRLSQSQLDPPAQSGAPLFAAAGDHSRVLSKAHGGSPARLPICSLFYREPILTSLCWHFTTNTVN
jgi:hypothetical protein